MMNRNPNIEIRNPKQIRKSKCQTEVYFDIRISNLFRISTFGFQIFLLVALPIAGAVAAIETTTILQQQSPVTLSVRAKVERGQIDLRLADSLILIITVDGSAQLEVKPSAIQASEVIKIRGRQAPAITEHKEGRRWQQTFHLEPLVPGDHSVQLQPLEYREKPGEWKTVKWRPVPIKVTTQIQSADADDLRDITDIEKLPERPSPWLWLAWGLAGVCGSAILLVGIRQWRKSRRRLQPALTPKQWAVRELERVLALNLPAKGEVERFHTMLSNVVRRYLENRYALPARRQTTPEFLQTMQTAPQLSADQQALARSFLERCDLAKFANAQATAEECALTAAMVAEFLEETPG